jgi:hypothetical protein
MKRVAIILTALALAGCGDDQYQAERGQLRIILAERCMSNLPEGPQRTTYNDWNEVVAQCDASAKRQVWKCGSDPRPCLRMFSPQEQRP